jgi:hypothetical protein
MCQKFVYVTIGSFSEINKQYSDILPGFWFWSVFLFRKAAKRKKDKAKETRRPKKKPKTGQATRHTVGRNWNDEGATAESDNETGTSTNNSASGSRNKSTSHGEVAQEESNGNHNVRDVSCSDGMASSSLTPLTFPKVPTEEVSIVVGKKLSLSQSIKAAQKNMVDRIQDFVKNKLLFRGVKFATSDDLLSKVMTAVEKNETTHENTTDNSGFKRVYSITVMKALSDKRGACAAAGGEIVQSMF